MAFKRKSKTMSILLTLAMLFMLWPGVALAGDPGPVDTISVTSKNDSIDTVANTVYGGSEITTVFPASEGEATAVCEISTTPTATQYTSLDDALAVVEDGQTITLLQNINHNTDDPADVITIDGKTVFFNLAGYTLNVGSSSANNALVVKNGGKLELFGDSGELNVTANGNAVQVEGISSSAVVTSATSVNECAVYAKYGGEITVRGDAEGKTCGAYAVNAVGAFSKITVGRDAKSTGDYSAAAQVSYGGEVTVNRNAIATGSDSTGVSAAQDHSKVHVKGKAQGEKHGVMANLSAEVIIDGDVIGTAYGVEARTKSKVTVKGDVLASGGIGVFVMSNAQNTPTEVTVDGAITGRDAEYIKLDGAPKTPADRTIPSTKIGYHTYSETHSGTGYEYTSTVWVKDPDYAPTQLTAPTDLNWCDTTPGAIKAEWNAVPNAARYEVYLYQVSNPTPLLTTSVDAPITELDFTSIFPTVGSGTYTFKVKAHPVVGSLSYTASDLSEVSLSSYTYTAPPTVNTYTVTFMNGSAVHATKTVIEPDATVGTLPANPTNGSYTFSGWYTGTNGSGSRFYADTLVTSNMTLYAYWTGGSSSSGGGGGGTTPAGALVTPTGTDAADNGVSLSFPPGAVESDIRVQVREASLTSGMDLPADSQLISKVVDIVKDKSGDFSEPVTITMSFNQSQIDPDKYDIKICYFDEENGEWVELDNIEVDLTKSTVSGEVTHFTKFAVIATLKEVEPEVTPQPPVPPAAKLPADIIGHWAKDSIAKLVQAGIVSGYPDGTFQPDKTVTRAEFTVMLVKALKLESKSGTVFADSTNHWAKDSISTAAAHGIISGYDQNSFGPDDNITREQAAVIIARAAKLQAEDQKLSFSDAQQISPWALSSITAAVSKSYLSGYPDNSFRPQGKLTRAEAAAIISKLL
jgi:hypothetical protein